MHKKKAFYKVHYTKTKLNKYYFNIEYQKRNWRLPTWLNLQYCIDSTKATKMFLLKQYISYFREEEHKIYRIGSFVK